MKKNEKPSTLEEINRHSKNEQLLYLDMLEKIMGELKAKGIPEKALIDKALDQLQEENPKPDRFHLHLAALDSAYGQPHYLNLLESIKALAVGEDPKNIKDKLYPGWKVGDFRELLKQHLLFVKREHQQLEKEAMEQE